ncbi:MAG: hypothetical protein GY754_04785 [bacterium]|nr:hypothetical protein [bacterium]
MSESESSPDFSIKLNGSKIPQEQAVAVKSIIIIEIIDSVSIFYIKYFVDYFNKVKPKIKIKKIYNEYYYRVTIKGIRDLLKQNQEKPKKERKKIRYPQVQFKGELPTSIFVQTVGNFKVLYTLSFTHKLSMQKKGYIKGVSFNQTKMNQELEIAIDKFALGFEMDGGLVKGVSLKSKFVLNESWNGEVKITNGNKLSVKFEQKNVTAKVGDVTIKGLVGMQLSGELIPDSEESFPYSPDPIPVPLGYPSWDELWDDLWQSAAELPREIYESIEKNIDLIADAAKLTVALAAAAYFVVKFSGLLVVSTIVIICILIAFNDIKSDEMDFYHAYRARDLEPSA